MGSGRVDASCLSGLKATLAGGDRRQDYLGQALADLGAEVWLLRRRPPASPTLNHTRSLAKAFDGTSILVCPLTPFGPRGRVWSEDPEDAVYISGEDFSRLARPSLAFAGSFPEEWAPKMERAGCQAVALGEMDDIAILNSIPTAEGAVLLALERTTVTIHGSVAVVLGYGRTGQTMAAALRGLGARVRVVARRPESRARAVASGCEPWTFEDLSGALEGARFIFNTVEAPVLDAATLSRVDPRAVLIDLASRQGGTDFEAARVLGLKAVLAPALPGRVAPETAASYLADVIVRTACEGLRTGGEA
ncbi:MAG: dipicolinate synthase subunit DpsA [Bacillota bacterium]|jgi:dipicolinate synthase subunit A